MQRLRSPKVRIISYDIVVVVVVVWPMGYAPDWVLQSLAEIVLSVCHSLPPTRHIPSAPKQKDKNKPRKSQPETNPQKTRKIHITNNAAFQIQPEGLRGTCFRFYPEWL